MAKDEKVGSKIKHVLLATLLCGSMISAPVVLCGCESQENDVDKALEEANRSLDIAKKNSDKAYKDLVEMERQLAPYLDND